MLKTNKHPSMHTKNINAHTLSISEIARLLHTSEIDGLNEIESKKRLDKYGLNILALHKSKSLFQILINQFQNTLVWILVFAGVLAFAFGEWLEGFAILVVMLVNVFIGFFMERQANRSMEALRNLSELNAVVIRNGKKQKVRASTLTIGDLLFLESGDVVTADCRLVQQNNLGVNEGTLTGESMPVSKEINPIEPQIPLTERSNMLFKGTLVNRGNATAIITETGANTALGHIANLTSAAKEDITPLEKKLGKLSQKLIGLTIGLAVIVFVAGMLHGRSVFLMIETAIALAIAAIPEGLPIVATIALANGMLRLAKENVIVKQLSAVETLGETQVIFTDKTGTLTENRMNVEALVFEHQTVEVNNLEAKKNTNPCFDRLIDVAVLCNNASIGKGEEATGDPIEVALLEFANKQNYSRSDISQKFPRVREIPFDASTKMMGTMHQMPNGQYLVCIKGALEVLLQQSDFTCNEDGGLSGGVDKNYWLEKSNALASKGMRVLAFAYSIVDHPKEDFFQHLNFIGCVAFLDPPRPEVFEAIQECKKAGIKLVMVTGDHPETAKTIAEKIDLGQHEHVVVKHASELATLSNDSEQLLAVDVFARVNPEQKLQLINAYQQQGFVTAMTGDGVNDAPALKKSDIGIAMGIRGTEAAKESADLILEDDALNSVVVAIRQGRGIYENIRFFVIYLLSCNLSELLVVTAMSVTNFATPLLPLQILFLNMVTDVFPALALGMNREKQQVMERSPRDPKVPIITNKIWGYIVGYAIAIAISVMGLSLFNFYYLKVDMVVNNNMVFYAITLAQLWHVFNLPGPKQSFWSNVVMQNKFIWGAILLCIGLVVLAYWIPPVNEVLGLTTISPFQLLVVFVVSWFPVLMIQSTRKIFNYKRN